MLQPNYITLDGYVDRLSTRSWVGQEERDAICALPVTYSKRKAGFSIQRCGEKIQTVGVVVEGIVGSVKINRKGDRRIVALHIKGDMADLPSLMFDEAVCALEAITDVSLINIDISALHSLASSRPMLAVALGRDCAADAAIALEWSANIGGKSARSRLSHLICELASRYEKTGKSVGLSFDLPMTQEHLADTIAVTSVHLNRTLQGLRADGILDIRNGVVEVFDWRALLAAVEFDPSYLRFSAASLQ